MIEITPNPIDTKVVENSVADPSAGAIDMFIGVTRNNAAGKPVLKLEYEAYELMAAKALNTLADEAKKRWQVCKISIVHRTGVVEIGSASVVIAVSAPHRREAFEACKYLIDELKKSVPIWKKEFFEDGEVWVEGTGGG